MRVLVAVHGFPPDSSGGAERVAERLARWLARDGHHVEVFTLDVLHASPSKIVRSEHEGFTVHRLSYDLGFPTPTLESSYSHPAIAEGFRAVLAGGDFDIVHIVSGYLLGDQIVELARQAHVPVVLTLTEYWFMCSRLNLIQPNGELCAGPESAAKCVRCRFEERRRFRVPARIAPDTSSRVWEAAQRLPVIQTATHDMNRRQAALKGALESADLVICPSEFLISRFAAYGYDTRRFVCVRHGPEHPVDQPQRRHDLAGDVLRLGYMGQVKPHKGVDLIVDAVMSLVDRDRPVELDIWGPIEEGGDYVKALMRRSRRYPSIRWQDGFDGSKVWEVLSGFDMLVAPSRWYENSPIVILEAFIAGVPVLATRLGGMDEMVDDECNGLLFELNDPGDLERQIERVLSEPGLLSRLRSGIPRVRTADEESREVFGLYTTVLRRVHR